MKEEKLYIYIYIYFFFFKFKNLKNLYNLIKSLSATTTSKPNFYYIVYDVHDFFFQENMI